MNEKGLVVTGLFMPTTKFPAPDHRPTISQLQWTQYQLDNYSTVAEVIEHAEDLRILHTKGAPGFHYFIWDKDENCAIIDWIEGRAQITTGRKVAIPLITNSDYQISEKSWRKNKLPEKDPFQSLSRYSRAANQIKKVQSSSEQDSVQLALKILNTLSWEAPTQWQVIYNPINLKISFQTRSNQRFQYIKLSDLDFACNRSVKFKKINEIVEGNVAKRMKPFNIEINREVITNAFFKSPFSKKASSEVVLHRSQYPSTWYCVDSY